MKKFTKPILLVTLLAGASVAAAIAIADGPGKPDAAASSDQDGRRWREHRGRNRSFAGMLSQHAQELGLTTQQLQAIQSAEQAARPDLDRLFQAVRDQRKPGASTPATPEQLQTAQQALQTRREALRTQIDALLTPEQRTKLQGLRSQMRDKGSRRDHHHGKDTQAPAPQ